MGSYEYLVMGFRNLKLPRASLLNTLSGSDRNQGALLNSIFTTINSTVNESHLHESLFHPQTLRNRR